MQVIKIIELNNPIQFIHRCRPKCANQMYSHCFHTDLMNKFMSGLCLLTWKKLYGFCTWMYFSDPFLWSKLMFASHAYFRICIRGQQLCSFSFYLYLIFFIFSYACRRTTETIPSTTFVTVSACLRWCTVWFTCVSFGITWQGRSWESYWLQQCVTISTTLAIIIRTYDQTIHHFNGKLFITRLKYTPEREALSQPAAMQNSLATQTVNIYTQFSLHSHQIPGISPKTNIMKPKDAMIKC